MEGERQGVQGRQEKCEGGKSAKKKNLECVSSQVKEKKVFIAVVLGPNNPVMHIYAHISLNIIHFMVLFQDLLHFRYFVAGRGERKKTARERGVVQGSWREESECQKCKNVG